MKNRTGLRVPHKTRTAHRRLLAAAVVCALSATGCVAPSTFGPTPTLPDGTVTTPSGYVVYSSKEPGGTAQLYRMRTDGTGRTALTADAAHENLWPRPNPDGSKILFYKSAPGSTVNDIDTNELWVMDGSGANARRLIADGQYGWTRQGHAEWSPDGKALVMAAGTATDLQLWVTDAQGATPTKVTNRRNSIGGSSTAMDPSWAPDGRTLVFVGCPPEAVLCFPWNQEVYRVDALTGAEVRLTNDGTADFDPYVSPDGRTLVWLRNSGGLLLPPWGLYRAPMGTSVVTPVAVVDDGQVNSNAKFSRDGSTLVFNRHVLGGATTMTTTQVHLDGTGMVSVPGKTATADEGGAAYWP